MNSVEVPHSKDCKCAKCKIIKFTKPLLKANSYKTKTRTTTAQFVEYSGNSWVVYYESVPDDSRFGINHGLMTLEVWNKCVEKYKNGTG